MYLKYISISDQLNVPKQTWEHTCHLSIASLWAAEIQQSVL